MLKNFEDDSQQKLFDFRNQNLNNLKLCFIWCKLLLAAEVESSRTHFEVLGLEGQVLGLGLEASSPRKLACPRLKDSTIF